jgi:uncharacterized membrane protein
MVRLLDKVSEEEIIEVIRQAESGTSGEIRVRAQKASTRDPMADARKFFRKTKMHRTRERNGVLIFISWKSRAFAVFGDEGIHRAVGDAFWNDACDRIKAHFLKNELKEGIIAGVKSVAEKLKAHFPPRKDDRNELLNTVSQE